MKFTISFESEQHAKELKEGLYWGLLGYSGKRDKAAFYRLEKLHKALIAKLDTEIKLDS